MPSRRALVFLSLIGSVVGATAYVPMVGAQGLARDAMVFLAQNGTQPAKRDAKTVTVDFKNAPCQDVLSAIAKQADVNIAFTNEQMKRCPKLTVKLKRASVNDALTQVIKNTPFTLFESAPGRFVLMDRATAPRDSTVGSGAIQGRVVDSSGRAVVSAHVTIEDTKQSALTADNGDFSIRNVRVGEHRLLVRVFGYRAASYPVTVNEGATATARVVLIPIPTALSGVVTTATGLQRKIEVGNDITSIDVEEVMRIMPVSSFTDLLATRVPGLDVQKSSGAPGAPSRVRIRGVSSILSTNEPIVILDGIRMYADQQRRQEEFPKALQPLKETETKSPLDQIDPNSISTVEVLKGPSAVALYGTDAANGVIVVTTKRGKPGHTLWSASGAWGTETTPGKYPMNYFRWGTDSQGAVGHCILGNVFDFPGSSQSCTPDSTSIYQILNNEHTTVLGRGNVATYRTSVSGGGEGLSYALSGSIMNNVGMLKMPDADVAVLRAQGDSLPDWMIHPQADEEENLTMNISSAINKNTQVTLTSGIVRSEMRTTPLSGALSAATQALPLTGADSGTNLLHLIPRYRERGRAQSLRSFNAGTFTTTPWLGIEGQVTGGLDLSTKRDQSALLQGACPYCQNGDESHYTVNEGNALVTSLNVRASRSLTFGSALSLRTSIGGNYVRTNTSDFVQNAQILAPGASTGANALITISAESRDDRSTAGAYVETTIGIANRFYIPLAFRKDAGSALGKSVAPVFPKLATSWLVSDQPFFPKSKLLNTLRLRVAYGQSGVQPGPAVKLRTYTPNSNTWVDGNFFPGVSIAGLGNLNLRPERSREFEGGFDVATAGDRVSLSVTMFRKKTVDALVDHQLPLSVNGGATTQENIGNVDNRGFEYTIDVTPVESQAALWRVSTGISSRKNKLLTLGQSAPLGGDSARFVVGYPLFGRWARPVTAYGDLNHDGFVTPDEVQLGDSTVFLGAPYPNYEMSFNSTLTLFNRFTVGTTFDYQNGMNQYNGLLGGPTSQAWNDPATSLGAQAYVGVGAYGKSPIGYAQTVSTFRFNALSLNYAVPLHVSRMLFGKQQVSIAVQGQNLGLWTNYRGKDPNVSATLGDLTSDPGVIPEPRTWQFVFRLN